MERKLTWTHHVSNDIEAIVRYIARRDPKAAAEIGFGIYHRAQILLEHPESGTVLEELRAEGWRKLIYRRWKIVYKIAGEMIVIGRVWPAAAGEADLERPL